MPIRRLSVQLANQIAAGEVVERPASVVKELLENAIDAKSSIITLEIKAAGKLLIKVTDNGVGIPKDELNLALAPHATSKIHTVEDLDGIVTLGFRGEALASIASVSKLTLISRTKDEPHAFSVEVSGPNQESLIAPAAHPIGTSVIVRDLFFNTPARRKFLKSDKTEFNHIKELLVKLALVNYDREFNFIADGKVILQVPASTKANLPKRLAKLLGSEFSKEAIVFDSTDQVFVEKLNRLHDILNPEPTDALGPTYKSLDWSKIYGKDESSDEDESGDALGVERASSKEEQDLFDSKNKAEPSLNLPHGLNMHGVILRPASLSRALPDRLITFLNGRCISDRTVNHALRDAYLSVVQDKDTSFKPSMRAVIFMECDPKSVDVNVHPRKDEVRFHDSNAIHDAIFKIVKGVLTLNGVSSDSLVKGSISNLDLTEVEGLSAKEPVLSAQSLYDRNLNRMREEVLSTRAVNLSDVPIPERTRNLIADFNGTRTLNVTQDFSTDEDHSLSVLTGASSAIDAVSVTSAADAFSVTDAISPTANSNQAYNAFEQSSSLAIREDIDSEDVSDEELYEDGVEPPSLENRKLYAKVDRVFFSRNVNDFLEHHGSPILIPKNPPQKQTLPGVMVNFKELLHPNFSKKRLEIATNLVSNIFNNSKENYFSKDELHTLSNGNLKPYVGKNLNHFMKSAYGPRPFSESDLVLNDSKCTIEERGNCQQGVVPLPDEKALQGMLPPSYSGMRKFPLPKPYANSEQAFTVNCSSSAANVNLEGASSSLTTISHSPDISSSMGVSHGVWSKEIRSESEVKLSPNMHQPLIGTQESRRINELYKEQLKVNQAISRSSLQDHDLTMSENPYSEFLSMVIPNVILFRFEHRYFTVKGSDIYYSHMARSFNADVVDKKVAKTELSMSFNVSVDGNLINALKDSEVMEAVRRCGFSLFVRRERKCVELSSIPTLLKGSNLGMTVGPILGLIAASASAIMGENKCPFEIGNKMARAKEFAVNDVEEAKILVSKIADHEFLEQLASWGALRELKLFDLALELAKA